MPDSVSDRNSTPRSPSWFRVVTRSGMDRPRRSSFQTTRVSPGPMRSSKSLRPGRSIFAPEVWSIIKCSSLTPASRSAANCSAGSWSVVETRA
ncbi:Hypothetical protein PFR_JS25-2_33 [Propionibacterium freudenreichii]|nr:Hypothetical protein PFR_JS25-2_33 [Propionibacterium freudenreichii]